MTAGASDQTHSLLDAILQVDPNNRPSIYQVMSMPALKPEVAQLIYGSPKFFESLRVTWLHGLVLEHPRTQSNHHLL